ncbi:MAG: hypothetical protein ABL921_00190 [Pirellula sp.]
MSENPSKQRIAIPDTLVRQLAEFRRRVWTIKMLESVGIACVAVFFGFLAVFALDRMFDSPSWVRVGVLLVATAGVASIPLWFEKWVLRVRSPESVAKLLGKRMPAVGDSLLGAIELAASDSEQSRSPALCRAALEQVAQDSAKRDLLVATPMSRHRGWGAAAGVGVAFAAGLWLLFPTAASNALARFVAPFSNVDRYTFAALDSIPNKLIVPHGEVVPMSIKLAENSEWSPAKAKASIGNQVKLESQLNDKSYHFELPPQIAPATLSLTVGDATPSIAIEPKLRPELESILATITLPKYLQRSEPLSKDVRGGGLSVVKGSSVALAAMATSDLAKASIGEQPVAVVGRSFNPESGTLEETSKFDLQWADTDGLTSKTAFVFNVSVREDEPPTVYSDGLPRSKVLLDSEQVQFTVRSLDDFGVKHIGMEWKTAEGFQSAKPTSGEVLLVAGNPNAETLDAMATFQATSLKISPQPLEVRMFAEDYLSERGRVYSAPHLLYVLTPEEHQAWILEQMTKWHRESMEVRDRELQLLATNKKIRDLSEDELNQEETRRKIEQQSSAEQANGRRLNNLTAKGDDLLRQAARNPEIGVGHLEKWAEMQQILKDIASNRMPSVAGLLKQAKDAKKLVKASPASKSGPMAGSIKDLGSNPSDANAEGEPKPPTPPVPSIVDRESSQQPPIAAKDPQEGSKKKGGAAPSLRLPSTTVMGKPQAKKPGEDEEEEEEAENKIEQAVRQQEELLAEFEKIADELNQLMANLEGSTLVKRLKAASREQIQIADATSNEIDHAFGSTLKRLKTEQQRRIGQLKTREERALNTVSTIIDDLEAFHERRPLVKFQSVLDEMKSEDVLGGIRILSERISEAQGLAIAEAEYWSDTMDRWAEDLVDPACKGECKGSKSKSSLPPSIILEVMQILEAEINLRDRTRVAEQAKAATEFPKYFERTKELAKDQLDLEDRIAVVRTKILELPDAQSEFAKEIELMQEVDLVMLEAAQILERPETGKVAIAAETEIIELLLKSKRINPKSGGGGGSDPGGGGGGDTVDAAIALIGPGINEKEARQDHGVQQSTGTTGTSFPEEYRQGLDEYFQRLERKALP